MESNKNIKIDQVFKINVGLVFNEDDIDEYKDASKKLTEFAKSMMEDIVYYGPYKVTGLVEVDAFTFNLFNSIHEKSKNELTFAIQYFTIYNNVYEDKSQFLYLIRSQLKKCLKNRGVL